MTDNVLQSFCERCGARFTQPAPAEKPPPAASMLGRLRRRTAEPESAPDDAAALPISEAFRDTFHFCMGCRRYNCNDCWNDQEGHCLSCRPHEGPATASAPGSGAPDLGRVRNPGPGPTVQPADTTVVWPPGDSGHAEPAAGQATSPWGPVAPPAGTESGERQAAERPTASGTPAPGGSPADAADDAAAADAASPADLPWTPAPELDPWRGVVFSSQDRGRVEPSAAPAWEPPVAPSGPPSAPVAAEDVGVLASLIDSEAHVDAADWARASSSVVGSGSLKASRPVETGGPEEPEPAEPEKSAAALLPEEPEPAEAEEPAAALLPEEPEPAEPEEPEPAEAEEPAAATPAVPTTPPSELGGADEAPLAPLPETEAWLDIARRGFDQMPDPGAGLAETAASPDDGWATDEAEQPELAQQPTPVGALTPTPLPPQPPGPSVATPPPAAPLAPPPLPPVQEMSPRQAAPATPPPGLAVWATPVDPGPFAKPYQAPPPEATIFMSDAPAAPVVPDARQVAPPGPQLIVPPGPLPALSPAGQAMPGHAGALPTASPSSLAYVPPLPGPATGQLSPPAAAPPPGVSAGQPPVLRQGAASRACPGCSLPLSTKARFCRRCGAPQPP